MPERMKAAVVYGINDLRVEMVEKPDVLENSIRIKVEACAICGTDRRIYRKGDYRAAYPVITGHEIAGVVESVANGVKSVKAGDRVCVAPGHGCGYCRMCRSGFPNVCLTPHPSLGYKLNGGFAEYMAVPEHIFRLGFVNPIPDSLSFEQAALSEIIACCINAQNNSVVNEGDRVLIIGSGPAGIIHAHLSKLNGAKKVIVTQRSKHRLNMAQAIFPDVVDRIIASSEEDLHEAIMNETEGQGADVIFVCAPSREAQEQSARLVANRGRINFFGGLPKEDCIVKLDSNELHYKEFSIFGASSSLPENNREALKILAERKIDPDKLITHVFSLDDIQKGFDVLEERQCIKVVIKP
jgi:L-iditol 2-dehydrogenase